MTSALVVIATVTAVTTIVSIQQQQQLAYTIVPAPCPACAKEFTPGQLKIDSDFESTSAKPFAPGQEFKIIGPEQPDDNGASAFAPGQEFKIIGPE